MSSSSSSDGVARSGSLTSSTLSTGAERAVKFKKGTSLRKTDTRIRKDTQNLFAKAPIESLRPTPQSDLLNQIEDLTKPSDKLSAEKTKKVALTKKFKQLKDSAKELAEASDLKRREKGIDSPSHPKKFGPSKIRSSSQKTDGTFIPIENKTFENRDSLIKALAAGKYNDEAVETKIAKFVSLWGDKKRAEILHNLKTGVPTVQGELKLFEEIYLNAESIKETVHQLRNTEDLPLISHAEYLEFAKQDETIDGLRSQLDNISIEITKVNSAKELKVEDLKGLSNQLKDVVDRIENIQLKQQYIDMISSNIFHNF